MGDRWWHWFERENIPVIYCMLRDTPHAFRKEFKDFTTILLKHIFVWKDRVLHVYWKQENLDDFSEFYLQQIIDKTDFMKRLEENHCVYAEKLINFSKTFPRINFKDKSDKELLDYFEEFEKRYGGLAVYTYIPVIGTFAIEDVVEPYLKKKLKNLNKEEKYGEYLSTLTNPDEKSWVRLEEEDLFKIAEEIKKGVLLEDPKIQELIDNHVEKYCWLEIGYKFLDKPLTKEYFLSKLNEFIKTGLVVLPSGKELKAKKEKIVKELEIDEKHLILFKVLGRIIYLKEYRDGIFARSHYELNFLIQEILRRFDVSDDVGEYMTVKEYKDLLCGRRIDIGKIKERKNLFVWMCDGKEEFLEGSRAEGAIKKELGFLGIEKKDISEIKGAVASSGVVKGNVKIVRNEEDLGKVEKGDVLVAYMTKPSYLTAMKKASAFVTNEGGITCHASIVSREMKKPCIINTKIAMKVLKDGDLVEVDADKGIVKVLERKNGK